ncbi:MAG: hypothetical protein AAFX08_09755 [Pseudomonadota bacterium]
MKLPMLRPVLEAVTFGFDRIGMMIRIAWLPILLVIALQIGAGAMICDSFGVFDNAEVIDLDALGEPNIDLDEIDIQVDPGSVGGAFLWLLVVGLGTVLLFAPVLVAATRAATRDDYEPPSGPAYFAMGPRQVRYAIVQIVYGLLVLLLAVLFGGAAFTVGAGAVAVAVDMESQLSPLLASSGITAGIAIAIIGIWIGLRFLPVLAIAAVEDRIAFGDAWTMTKGNFWRLVLSALFFLQILQGATYVLFIVFVVPVLVIAALIAGAISGLIGPAAFVLVGLAALVLLPAVIAVAAFSLGAQAAYPGRVYAYLSGCGDDCKIL